ncbi:EamA family transporter [soil metagenome]
MSTPSQKTAAPLMVGLAFAIVYIVWGSTYFFIQQAMKGFPPFLLGATRFLLSGILMLGYGLLTGVKVFVWKDIGHASISGMLMLFAGTGAVIWVEQFLPSAMAAIMVSSAPLWFVLLDKPKWAINFTSKTTIGGLLLGFVGVIILFGEKVMHALNQHGSSLEISGLGILIIGSMCWAAGSLYSKYTPTKISVFVNSGWQMLAAGIAFIPGSLLRGEMNGLQWGNISTGAWLSVLYLVFFGSIAGFSAYVWLLKVRSATQVSTHAYVNPVVAVLLGMFFANEVISLVQVAGLVVILASVMLISLVRYRKEKMVKTSKYNGSRDVIHIQSNTVTYDPAIDEQTEI